MTTIRSSARFTIYRYTNKITGKSYVGQTTRSREARWTSHRRSQGTSPFVLAVREFGDDAWDHDVLDVVTTPDGANAAESAWIEHLGTLAPSGYNVRAGNLVGDKAMAVVPANAKIQEKWKRCGSPDCDSCPHGPYLQAMWWENGRCRTKYIGKKVVN